jgi:prepilin-type N-terminal cleavage/methylation domain-containing protein
MNKLARQAFTLIELLVVIAIIGILSGLIVVSMGGMTQKATIAKAQVFSNSLRNSLLLNLKSEIKFDENSGQNIGDNWGGTTGYLGSSTSVEASDPAWSSDCVYKNCLSFGDDDFVLINSNSNLQFPGDVTMSLWVYNSNSSLSVGTLLNKGTQNSATPYWYIYANGTDKTTLNWQYTNGTVWTSVSWTQALAVNQWSHLVFAYNHTAHTVTLYVNGVPQVVRPTPGSLPVNNSSALYVGTYQAYTATYNFKGKIDELLFFDAVMSTSQIKEQYYAGLNKMLANGNINNEEYKQRIEEISLNK